MSINKAYYTEETKSSRRYIFGRMFFAQWLPNAADEPWSLHRYNPKSTIDDLDLYTDTEENAQKFITWLDSCVMGQVCTCTPEIHASSKEMAGYLHSPEGREVLAKSVSDAIKSGSGSALSVDRL